MKRGEGSHAQERLSVSLQFCRDRPLGLLLSLLDLQCQQQSLARCQAGDKPHGSAARHASTSRSDLPPRSSRRINPSRAVQSLRICLPMQGTPVRSRVRELRAHRLQLLSLRSGPGAPQLEKALAETRGLLATAESQHSQGGDREDTSERHPSEFVATTLTMSQLCQPASSGSITYVQAALRA